MNIQYVMAHGFVTFAPFLTSEFSSTYPYSTSTSTSTYLAYAHMMQNPTHQNILQLPEIASNIIAFLSTRDVYCCLFVCRNWNAVFESGLWRTTVCIRRPQPSPSRQTYDPKDQVVVMKPLCYFCNPIYCDASQQTQSSNSFASPGASIDGHRLFFGTELVTGIHWSEIRRGEKRGPWGSGRISEHVVFRVLTPSLLEAKGFLIQSLTNIDCWDGEVMAEVAKSCLSLRHLGLDIQPLRSNVRSGNHDQAHALPWQNNQTLDAIFKEMTRARNQDEITAMTLSSVIMVMRDVHLSPCLLWSLRFLPSLRVLEIQGRQDWHPTVTGESRMGWRIEVEDLLTLLVHGCPNLEELRLDCIRLLDQQTKGAKDDLEGQEANISIINNNNNNNSTTKIFGSSQMSESSSEDLGLELDWDVDMEMEEEGGEGEALPQMAHVWRSESFASLKEALFLKDKKREPGGGDKPLNAIPAAVAQHQHLIFLSFATTMSAARPFIRLLQHCAQLAELDMTLIHWTVWNSTLEISSTETMIQMISACPQLRSLTLRFQLLTDSHDFDCTASCLDLERISTVFPEPLRSLSLLGVALKDSNFVRMEPEKIRGIQDLKVVYCDQESTTTPMTTTSVGLAGIVKCPIEAVEFIMIEFWALTRLEIGMRFETAKPRSQNPSTIPSTSSMTLTSIQRTFEGLSSSSSRSRRNHSTTTTTTMAPPRWPCQVSLQHLDICTLPLFEQPDYANRFLKALGPRSMPRLSSLRIHLWALREPCRAFLDEELDWSQLRTLFIQGSRHPDDGNRLDSLTRTDQSLHAGETGMLGHWRAPITVPEVWRLQTKVLSKDARLVYCHFGELRTLKRQEI